MRVLHVVNYGWPHVDGYTARSRSLVTAQREVLGIDTVVAVSPYPAFARARDPALTTDAWGPAQVPVPAVEAGAWWGWAGRGLGRWERPTLGLAPLAEGDFGRGLDRVLREVAPDVVHAHHPAFVGRPAWRAARAHGLPLVYEVRCFNGDYDLDTRNPYLRARGRRQNSLETALARAADHVVTIGTGLARRLTGAGVDPGRLSVVGNAVDTAWWRPLPRPRHQGVLRVGYATTFEAIETLDTLVDAVARARPRLARHGVRLEVVLAGTGRDWQRIRDLVEQAGLAGTVELPGFLTLAELQQLYASLDLFVVPRGVGSAAADTTPLKPLEALAAGVPLLATDLPAMRELVAGQQGVVLVPPDPASLADGLVAFADDPWATADVPDLGERAWARQVEGYREVYAAVGCHV